MKKRGHGATLPDGKIVLAECAEDAGEVMIAAPLREGRLLNGSGQIVRVEQAADGRHVEYEIVDIHDGPAQVATPAYRRGWDETFKN